MHSTHRPNVQSPPFASFRGVRITPRIAGGLLAIASLGTIAAMFILQFLGFEPCELCYKERIPFYAVTVLAAAAFLLCGAGRVGLARVLLVLCGVALLFDAGLFLYHAGVEWKWWPGPDSCTGQLTSDPNISMMERLNAAHVVRCDEPALRVFGISLAGYGVPAAAVLAALAFWGGFRPCQPGIKRRREVC
jgi:disulfide bond formation protein DsbB